MSRTKRAVRSLPPDYDPEFDPGYGATRVQSKKPPGRAQAWLRSFAITSSWYLAPLVVLAVLAGPTRMVSVPFVATPKPLLLVAVALAVITATVERLRGWQLTRSAR